MKKIGKMSALQAALLELKEDKIEEGEFTAKDFIAMSGQDVSSRRALNVLERYVKEGKLKRRFAVIDGRRTNVYKEVQ